MSKTEKINRLFSIAPMMGWTDRHCRYFHRLISPNSLLYTVMITSGALKHGDADFHLRYNEEEHPVALQLGGNDPKEMAFATKLAEQYQYDEVNINCGCPSDRVQKGFFGACLMAEPQTVANCVDAMKQISNVPVTIKTRIGIDHQDSYEFLTDFVGKNAEKGCKTFIIHARKAWLNGLSPKENRDIPPLDYKRVYQLKKDFPNLEILINGGIKTVEDTLAQIPATDGVMMGREAYKNPWIMHHIEKTLFKNEIKQTRYDVVLKMVEYANKECANGTQLKDITKHMLGLYLGCAGARTWRRRLSVDVLKSDNNPQLLIDAADEVEQAIKDRELRAA